jgi:serine/threonine protein phosphatase PrpC
VVLIVGDMCYTANVGDSRAIISTNAGKSVYALSRDHKPEDAGEQARVTEAGGRIYQ